MTLEELHNNIVCILQKELSEQDLAIFLCKIFGRMSNVEISRALNCHEKTIRRRFKDIQIKVLKPKTAYIYEGNNFIDLQESEDICGNGLKDL